MKKINLIFIVSITAAIFSACAKQKQDISINTDIPKEPPTIVQESMTKPLASEKREKEDFISVFNEYVLKSYFDSFEKATFIVDDGEERNIYNEVLANAALPPYSTFKIPNSIIALETKVIENGNSLKTWDGTIYSRDVVNQNHDLATAFEHSVVWYYQELAKDIGADEMIRYLDLMSYGNQDISGGIDEFWLGSSMQISPLEQIEFLKKFYHNDFIFSKDTIDTVKSIMKQKNTELELYGKSGSSGDGMSWFIGYITVENKPYFFVTYLEDEEKGLQAKQFTTEMLTDLVLKYN